MQIGYVKDPLNIVTLTIDTPGRPVNVINEEFTQAFSEAVERVAVEQPLAGVILASAKSTFIAGADLDFLFSMTDPGVLFQWVQGAKRQMRRLETLGVPVVAAMNGTALGGGLEVALACHHRVAIDDPRTRIGQVEVTLGLIPGGGGIARLTRLVGLQNAFNLCSEGKQLNPKEALAAGIVSELATDKEDMMARARAWILAHPKSMQPWDDKAYRMPGGSPTNPAMAQMLAVVPAMVRKKTYGNYPAAEAIMNAIVEGALVDFDTANRIESRYFAQVTTGQVAKNSLTAFWYQMNKINGGQSRPAGIGKTDTRRLGVLGAGLMGHGIAYVSAVAGIDVVMKDVTQERAEAGKARIEAMAAERVAKGRMKEEEKAAILSRVHPTGNARDLQECDLIIEAVFEDREVKAAATIEAEAQIGPDVIVGSNTSTLPITSLAARSTRPDNFIGVHFFSPVPSMRLVEIIVGQETSDRAIAAAFDYAQKIRKTPIVVNDGRGFYTSRVFGTYVSEGMALLAEGCPAQEIESAGLQAGMPMGPLLVADQVGLSLILHIREQTAKDLLAEGKTVPREIAADIPQRMVKEQKRTGKDGRAGFYDYPQGGEPTLWQGLKALFPQTAARLPQPEMIERMMFVQALETVRCLDEGIVRTVADANIGSILGWGFAPFKGGTLQYINDYGVARFVARARELAARYGARFEPSERLIRMAANGETFQ